VGDDLWLDSRFFFSPLFHLLMRPVILSLARSPWFPSLACSFLFDFVCNYKVNFWVVKKIFFWTNVPPMSPPFVTLGRFLPFVLLPYVFFFRPLNPPTNFFPQCWSCNVDGSVMPFAIFPPPLFYFPPSSLDSLTLTS